MATLNDKKFLKAIDELWGRVFAYNMSLLKKSEDMSGFGNETFEEIINFYLSSQVLSFVKGVFISHLGSPGMLFNARCFLEGLALKRKYEKGDISEQQIRLLKKQLFLVEYNCYKKFQDIADAILIPEKLTSDYNETVKFFKDELSSSFEEKEICNIIKSNSPFLCVAHVSNRELVKQYLGKKFAELYGLLSQAVHPSCNDFYSNSKIWKSIPKILELMQEEFSFCGECKNTFSLYSASVLTSKESISYTELVNKECNLLQKVVSAMLGKFGKNYISDTLTSMKLLLEETRTDFLFGLCEQVKSKWKLVIELLASLKKCYFDSFPHEERYKLLVEHQKFQFKKNIGKEYQLDEAFSYYQKLYKNGVDRVKFESSFASLAGYLIDDKGNASNLSSMVNDFLKTYSQQKSENGVSFDKVMSLNYVESQMLSHANGYMWYANSGSWGDVNNVLIGTDICIGTTLERILMLFKMHRIVEGTDDYLEIINSLDNCSKEIRRIVLEKDKILKIKGSPVPELFYSVTQ